MNGVRIDVLEGDITRAPVDAIVGAIHRAAGPGLLEECRALGGCPTGRSKVTGGHDVATGHVIRTVWRGAGAGEDERRASCYRESLACAAGIGAASVAFPAISTGAYGFPPDRAARVAVATIRAHAVSPVARVLLVAFGAEAASLLRGALEGET